MSKDHIQYLIIRKITNYYYLLHHRTSPRDVTIIAGVWDLDDKSRLMNRVADIQVHPRYKAGVVDNNLAVLVSFDTLSSGIF